MSSDPVLSVENLGKRFYVYTRPIHRLCDWLVPFGRRRSIERWALKDVSFELRPGELIGVVGVNGAGKSTLLKCISRIIEPTRGRVQAKGLICSMIELRSGINRNLTGRDNLYFLASLHGYRRAWTSARLEKMIEFSELGDSIEEPARTYSSGMLLRLAFSAYAYLEPSILLIDEAFAVGDAHFQVKCIRRIQELSRRGTASMLVSHNSMRIKSYCNKTLWLDEGRLAGHGDTLEVLRAYGRKVAEMDRKPAGQEVPGAPSAASVRHLKVLDAKGRQTAEVLYGEPFSICSDVRFNEDVDNVSVCFEIRDILDRPVWSVVSFNKSVTWRQVKAGRTYRFQYDLEKNILGPGIYAISIRILRGKTELASMADAEVIRSIASAKDGFVGMVDLGGGYLPMVEVTDSGGEGQGV